MERSSIVFMHYSGLPWAPPAVSTSYSGDLYTDKILNLATPHFKWNLTMAVPHVTCLSVSPANPWRRGQVPGKQRFRPENGLCILGRDERQWPRSTVFHRDSYRKTRASVLPRPQTHQGQWWWAGPFQYMQAKKVPRLVLYLTYWPHASLTLYSTLCHPLAAATPCPKPSAPVQGRMRRSGLSSPHVSQTPVPQARRLALRWPSFQEEDSGLKNEGKVERPSSAQTPRQQEQCLIFSPIT